ncbi:MAG: hypothetical protein LBB07_02980, partial [Bifidobacteriaceae bacterium]|nr:hypothetical protein [Bifidobacteriaceae bacterium]
AIPWPRAPLWFNGSWLAKLGITKLPDTLDEFHNLLVRFRDEDPNGNGKKDDIPLTGSTLDNPLNGLRPWLITAFGLLGNDIEVHDGKVSFAPIENSFKEWVTYMHQLYSEGLIDKEMFTQSESNLTAKGAANQVGLFPAWYSFQVTGQTEDQALQNPMISPLVKSADQKKMTVGTTGMAPGAFMVTKGTQNAAALVRWVDYFYSSEGFLYINQGPAGSLWEYKTDSKGEKVRVYKSDLSEDQAEEKRGHITPDYGVVVPGCEIYLPQIRNSADDSKADDFQSFIKNEAKVKDSDYAALPYPSLFLSEEQSDIVNQIKVDLQTYVENMEAKFVTGAADINSQWDTYIATIQKMNIDAYIKAYQDAYDVWAKK